MEPITRRPLYVGLVHHPVVNRRGEPVTSAITNLDIHDIARTCKTYGVDAFYVINPAPSQRILLEEILAHWLTGAGAKTNPTRCEAFKIVRYAATIARAVQEIRAAWGAAPETWATSAKGGEKRISWEAARMRLDSSPHTPLIILFGTGGGLAQEVFNLSDFIVEPIQGKNGYNHLSVRSAVAITLDRLLTRRM